LYLSKCPWIDDDLANEAYLRMGNVTCVTFSYTFLHALFYMLCKGWSTTNNTVDRNQATNLTLVMGVVYLMYSAYFLAADLNGMARIICTIMTVIYVIIGYANISSIGKQISVVQALIVENDAVPASFQQSIRLKLKMLRLVRVVMWLFFLPKVVHYFLEGVNSQN
jgi:hypothetical protein